MQRGRFLREWRLHRSPRGSERVEFFLSVSRGTERMECVAEHSRNWDHGEGSQDQFKANIHEADLGKFNWDLTDRDRGILSSR